MIRCAYCNKNIRGGFEEMVLHLGQEHKVFYLFLTRDLLAYVEKLNMMFGSKIDAKTQEKLHEIIKFSKKVQAEGL